MTVEPVRKSELCELRLIAHHHGMCCVVMVCAYAHGSVTIVSSCSEISVLRCDELSLLLTHSLTHTHTHTHTQPKETWHVTTIPVKSFPCCSPLSPPLTSTNGRREEEGARTIFNLYITGKGEGGGGVTRECVRGREEWSH